MIRILHTLPDLALGGGQLLLLRNISAMDRAEFSHVICSLRPLTGGGMEPAFRDAGFDVLSLDLRSPSDFPGAVRRLARTVRERRIDLIHANNTGSDRMAAQAAAALTGRPVVNTLHSIMHRPRGGGSLKRALRRGHLALDRTLARRTIRHIIAVSRAARDSWLPYTRSYGIGEDRITVVHPGLDLARFAPPPPEAAAELRRTLGVEGASPLLVNVARLTNGKGHALLIPLMREVLFRHPRAKLLIVGDGELRQELEQQIAREGIGDAVVLAGRRDDIPAVLSLADLFVFPSHSEGFGLSLLEAMAAGRPIAAFALPTFGELGDGHAAALAPVGNAPALTRLVLDLLADPDRLASMAAAGRGVAERFAQDRASRAIEDIYRSVLGRA